MFALPFRPPACSRISQPRKKLAWNNFALQLKPLSVCLIYQYIIVTAFSHCLGFLHFIDSVLYVRIVMTLLVS